jgi:hypothetical protein
MIIRGEGTRYRFIDISYVMVMVLIKRFIGKWRIFGINRLLDNWH